MIEQELPQSSVRRHVAVLSAQLLLVVFAVSVARTLPPGRSTTAIIMTIAFVNGAVVAIAAMGARRDGWMVSTLMAMTLFFIIGLLIWPAWHIADRARTF